MLDPHAPALEPQLVPFPVVPRSPVWSAWDVLKIALLMFLTPMVVDLLLSFAARRFIYMNLSWTQVMQKPVVELCSEVIAYGCVLLYMIALIEGQYHRRFLEAIHWNWPSRVLGLAGLGALLLVSLQSLAHFLPIPKDVPFDEFFKHPLEAYLTSILAISLGPLMEELFFRGFLYPLLARSLGTVAGILLTAAAFGLLHAMQLGFAWAAVFVIFLVGVALTTVRAVTNSVGSSVVVHIAYNLTLTVVTFAGTGGFRHLERLSQ